MRYDIESIGFMIEMIDMQNNKGKNWTNFIRISKLKGKERYITQKNERDLYYQKKERNGIKKTTCSKSTTKVGKNETLWETR